MKDVTQQDTTSTLREENKHLRKLVKEIKGWCREDYKKAGATAEDVLGEIEMLIVHSDVVNL